MPVKKRRGRPSRAQKELERVAAMLQSDDTSPVTPQELDKQQTIEAALHSLEFFIKLVSPNRILGKVHIDLINWWTREDASSHQLVLLPRDHQKSALLAYRVAWMITKNPAIRILYISATSTLATKQLFAIKNILTSDNYRRFWPEMVNEREADREKWTETEISVDHPYRREKEIRDPTIFTAGLTTVITGLHCDIAALDDVVENSNAATSEGRRKVRTQVSYLASIGGAEGNVWAVGTRYHPKDQYGAMRDMIVEVFDQDGVIEESYPLYEIYEKQVEDRGDGTGEFLWPRTQAPNGDWFGFDRAILAKKKAQYESITDFRAQYYNNPNDSSEATITSDMFNYFDRNHLNGDGGRWSYKGSRLNVFAAIDFAFSLGRKADYTAIVVVGVDQDNNYYVLDINRFRTQQISEYFNEILRMHTKWNFRKLRAEVSIAQEVIVKDLKENYIRRYGLTLSIDEHRPTRNEGTKAERIEAILQPKYSNGQMWHYIGGNTELLEEELMLQRPPHDDIKDALAAAIDICVPPQGSSGGFISNGQRTTQGTQFREQHFHSRFGGFKG